MRAFVIEPGEAVPGIDANDVVIAEDVKVGPDRIRKGHRLASEDMPLLTRLDRPVHAVQLEPGEAIQLGPGNLHAYLSGAGIELMGASDNVVRAGLTSKRVNVDLLLDVMDPTPLLDPVMSTARSYPLSGTSIRLLRLVGPTQRTASTHELVVTASGATGYLAPHDTLDVPAGDIAFVATS